MLYVLPIILFWLGIYLYYLRIMCKPLDPEQVQRHYQPPAPRAENLDEVTYDPLSGTFQPVPGKIIPVSKWKRFRGAVKWHVRRALHIWLPTLKVLLICLAGCAFHIMVLAFFL